MARVMGRERHDAMPSGREIHWGIMEIISALMAWLSGSNYLESRVSRYGDGKEDSETGLYIQYLKTARKTFSPHFITVDSLHFTTNDHD